MIKWEKINPVVSDRLQLMFVSEQLGYSSTNIYDIDYKNRLSTLLNKQTNKTNK